jgi:hypothetical protein
LAPQPNLVPVRRRRRFGVDRGVIVAALVVGAVVVGVMKPWDDHSTPALERGTAAPTGATTVHPAPSSAHRHAGVEPSAAPASPQASAPVPSASPVLRAGAVALAPPAQTISWPELELTLDGLPQDPHASWVLPGSQSDPVQVELLAAVPTTAQLGPTCDGGVMLRYGYRSFGVTLPSARKVSLSVDRLFATEPSVPMSAWINVDREGHLARVSMFNTAWQPGHYALTISIGDASQYLPFCAASLLVEGGGVGSFVVPEAADSAQARDAMSHEAQP